MDRKHVKGESMTSKYSERYEHGPATSTRKVIAVQLKVCPITAIVTDIFDDLHTPRQNTISLISVSFVIN